MLSNRLASVDRIATRPDGGPPETSRRSVGNIQLYADTLAGPVRWRVLSGNNREVGRGAGEFRHADQCRAAVEQIRRHVDELEPFIRRASSSTWAWQLKWRGEPIAFSGRGFDRLIRCEEGVVQFRARLAEAEISADLLVSQARRWRAAGF